MSGRSAGLAGGRLPAPPLAGARPLLRTGMVGIARVDVVDADRAAGTPPLLVVRLQPDDATDRAPWLLDRAGYALAGGARLHPRIAEVTPTPGRRDEVTLRLDAEGDRDGYTLTLVGESADPFHGTAALRFRLDCAGADCAVAPVTAAPPPPATVRIDYLARDFEGFRRALQDFVPTRAPGWTETSEADAGVMLLELFAATADGFSYVLDRVANEAFLDTATERRSVAGHLALIGCPLDEGASAETVLQFRVSRSHLLVAGFAVRQQDGAGAVPAGDGGDGDQDGTVFETVADAVLLPAHNELTLYDWDSPDGYLPAGATTAYLVGDLPALDAGDLLALCDTVTGRAEVVRLDRVPDRLRPSGFGANGTPALTRITWSRDTALRHDHPVRRTAVRGNLVRASHGLTRRERIVLAATGRGGGEAAAAVAGTSAWAVARPAVTTPATVVLVTVWGLADGQDVVVVVVSPQGDRTVHTVAQDGPGGVDGLAVPIVQDAPAGIWRAVVGRTVDEALTVPQAVARWEVRAAGAPSAPDTPLPRLRVPVPGAPLGIDAAGRPQLQVVIDGTEWEWAPTLLDSGPRDRVFTLEFGDGGAATMLFGQGGTRPAGRGAFGLRPPDGAVLDLRFRVGLGTGGNVPAGTLTVPADQEPSRPGARTGTGDWLLAVTNPVPATGGRDPQELDDARRAGPVAAGRREVAVTARDYAEAVAEFDRAAGGGLISRAGAEFRWTGSWVAVDLVLDLADGTELDDRLAADLLAFLDRRRLAGYDLRLVPARDLPLQLVLTVCVEPGYLAGAVRQDVATALRPGVRTDGSRGLFDPEHLSFGDPVLLSRLHLALAAVPGVRSVTVDVLAPLDSATPEADTALVKATGQLTVGRDRIARLDDDPARPERGRLTLVTRGGS
ncbi:hypothetical protein [Kitasatospora sp. A2-31]|uniref:hypothetical protein n=1 Tax=Kitasatospora sp. A2-31 TaxID=2916414 RepID=UPI001EEAFAC2|nr:hypothetical protein [Kitasatospora sp. A2-31]MCG6495449.1 hypothetical protein [Kitasatospora sp. A2-31]